MFIIALKAFLNCCEIQFKVDESFLYCRCLLLPVEDIPSQEHQVPNVETWVGFRWVIFIVPSSQFIYILAGVSWDGRLSASCLRGQWRRFDDGRDWRHNLFTLSLRRHKAGRGQVNQNNILSQEYNQIICSLEGWAHILPAKWMRLVGVQYGKHLTSSL